MYIFVELKNVNLKSNDILVFLEHIVYISIAYSRKHTYVYVY